MYLKFHYYDNMGDINWSVEALHEQGRFDTPNAAKIGTFSFKYY